MSRYVWASGAGILLVVSGVGGVWWWLHATTTSSVVTITAALDVPEHGLPVFAQFNMTQTLVMTDPAMVTNLVVPAYFPQTNTEPLVVELRRYGKLVDRWRYHAPKAGEVAAATLPLTPPRLLDGEMSVHFSASALTHDQKEVAPRLFVETADSYYPNGNYFISENAKSGDIALQLQAETTNLDFWLAASATHPLKTVAYGSRWLLLALLVLAAPYVLARSSEAKQGN